MSGTQGVLRFGGLSMEQDEVTSPAMETLFYRTRPEMPAEGDQINMTEAVSEADMKIKRMLGKLGIIAKSIAHNVRSWSMNRCIPNFENIFDHALCTQLEDLLNHPVDYPRQAREFGRVETATYRMVRRETVSPQNVAYKLISRDTPQTVRGQKGYKELELLRLESTSSAFGRMGRVALFVEQPKCIEAFTDRVEWITEKGWRMCPLEVQCAASILADLLSASLRVFRSPRGEMDLSPSAKRFERQLMVCLSTNIDMIVGEVWQYNDEKTSRYSDPGLLKKYKARVINFQENSQGEVCKWMERAVQCALAVEYYLPDFAEACLNLLRAVFSEKNFCDKVMNAISYWVTKDLGVKDHVDHAQYLASFVVHILDGPTGNDMRAVMRAVKGLESSLKSKFELYNSFGEFRRQMANRKLCNIRVSGETTLKGKGNESTFKPNALLFGCDRSNGQWHVPELDASAVPGYVVESGAQQVAGRPAIEGGHQRNAGRAGPSRAVRSHPAESRDHVMTTSSAQARGDWRCNPAIQGGNANLGANPASRGDAWRPAIRGTEGGEPRGQASTVNAYRNRDVRPSGAPLPSNAMDMYDRSQGSAVNKHGQYFRKE